MEIAFRTARAAFVNGETGAEACRQAKAHASFAGPTPESHCNACSYRASPLAGDVQPRIALRQSLLPATYNVGHSLPGVRSRCQLHRTHSATLAPPLLHGVVFDVLSPQLAEVPGALVIPLDKAVEDCLSSGVYLGFLIPVA
jgi:hypothetical protein